MWSKTNEKSDEIGEKSQRSHANWIEGSDQAKKDATQQSSSNTSLTHGLLSVGSSSTSDEDMAVSTNPSNTSDEEAVASSFTINPIKRARTTHRSSFAPKQNNHSDDMETITERMGKLWYPTSVQEFANKHERDKYGRLVPSIEEKDRASSPADGSSSYNDTAKNSNYSEWYDAGFKSAYQVSTSLLGNLQNVTGEDIEQYEGTDQKLQASMMLTDDIDKAWAKELYELDANERATILNEIHGIASSRYTEETEESIEEAVTSFRSFLETNLDEELDNRDSIVPPVTKEHYRRGVYELKSDYIVSKPFLIKFLRTCFYNFEDAALRYFRYLDLLHLLFGDEALTRQLEMDDLTKRELRYLRKGQMQLLPSRDRAGRRIYAFSGCDDWQFNIREKYRVNVYVLDVLSDDVETQKLGAVLLGAPRVRYDLGDNPFGFEGMTLRAGKQELLGGKCTEAQFFRKMTEAFPIRYSGMHFFARPTMIYNIGRAIMLSLLGKDHRKIVRFHAGSHLECNYSLRSFGIPHEDITITDGDNIKTKNVAKFINGRRTIESFRREEREGNTKGEVPGIECPGVDCVVFGDKTMQTHAANVEFRELLAQMERERNEAVQNDYNVLPVKQFIESIIDKARSPEYNLRFLVFDKMKSLFVDIDDHNELCKRVSQAIRDQRKRLKLAQSHSERKQSASPQSQYGGDALEDSGSSIMGLEAAKRLKRSYNGNACANYLFCSDTKGEPSQENNGSIVM